jgi:hypothetical protein
VEATALAVQQLESDHDAALSQWRLKVERARYEAERAERQYKAVDPENRLVARGNGKHGCRILRQRKRNCTVGNNNALVL